MARILLAALILSLAIAVPAVAADSPGPPENQPVWNYGEVMQTARAHLSHPERWDFKIVVEFTKTTIVEHVKKRTGTVRYFVVTRRKRDGGLRLRWRSGSLDVLIAQADTLDGYGAPSS